MPSREEEVELARRSKTGDPTATARLVFSHLRYVVKVAHGYKSYGLPMSDLIQEGTLGLMHAIRKFNPDRNVRLATYAVWWIRASIQDHVVRSWSLVRIGTTAAQKALFFNLRRIAYELRSSTDALGDDIIEGLAKKFGLTTQEVAAQARRAAAADRSLNLPLAETASDEWVDRIADGRPDPEERESRASESRFRRRLLSKALAALTPREKTIIERRYLGEVGPTLEALGRELGISKERVRQLEQRALDKLRQLLQPAFPLT